MDGWQDAILRKDVTTVYIVFNTSKVDVGHDGTIIGPVNVYVADDFHSMFDDIFVRMVQGRFFAGNIKRKELNKDSCLYFICLLKYWQILLCWKCFYSEYDRSK